MKELALYRVQQYLATNALTPAARAAPDPQVADITNRTPASETQSTDKRQPRPNSSARPTASPPPRSTTTRHRPQPPRKLLSCTRAANPVALQSPHRSHPPSPTSSFPPTSSATAAFPPSFTPRRSPTSTTKLPLSNPVVYVTVVAQRLPSGSLSTSLASVTDSAHMDRVPWLRFIDVVELPTARTAPAFSSNSARSSHPAVRASTACSPPPPTRRSSPARSNSGTLVGDEYRHKTRSPLPRPGLSSRRHGREFYDKPPRRPRRL